ncbi:Zinc finger FYVE/PHD-type [Arabidopsis suecica]|uniref:Zinc finger FYVE/PHD-type n=1 Tax=Arabidopsis suecica TaxID=45249 RepID=A0A8T1XVK3_ARASU|nr:Zinc finger FYVE/PHD-type [Arabidopsis suecica]
MADESGYDAGSDASLPSSGSEISFVEIKKPCEVCGSNANDDEIMTCLFCRDTREHIYCSRGNLGSVPPMWMCEECISSRINRVVNNEAPIDQAAASSRSTYQVVDSEVVHQNMTSSDSGNQISATHDQPSQAHASSVAEEAVVPMDTSSGENQKPPSDSESAI